VHLKLLTDRVLRMHVGANGRNGSKPGGEMKLVDAAFLIERLQARAAHAGEAEALKIARDALLTIIAEGFTTLADRLGDVHDSAQQPRAS
jgi:hypothetical protein